MLGDASLPHIPDMTLIHHIFNLKMDHMSHLQKESESILLDAIRKNKMGPFYLYLHNHNILPWDEQLYTQIKEENDAEIDRLDEQIKQAKELNGEHETTEAFKNKAEYLASIADKERALLAYQIMLDRNGSTGNKLDTYFGIMRLGFFFSDWHLVGNTLDIAKASIEDGGDWERRNRMKCYEGLYCLYCRRFTEAANLLLDSISTFSSTELMSYNDIVKYAVIAGAVSLPRTELKKKIIDSSEVLAVLPSNKSMQSLEECVNSLYLCDYARFMRALAIVEQKHLKTDPYFYPHTRYYVREMRRRSYLQLLESYKALSIESMAQAFGVTASFIDADLAKFIPEKKMFCIIDRVNGKIEMNRLDVKDHQYQEVIKQGDVLLNKLQKYQTAVSSLK